MGINNYYFNNIDARLWDVDNYDFWLDSDNQKNCLDYSFNCSDESNIVTDGLVLWIDINNSGSTINGSDLKSLVSWDEKLIKISSGETSTCDCYLPLQSNPTGITLCDFGLTSVDNGRFDSLSGVTVVLTQADDKIILHHVTGYTLNNVYSAATKGIYDYDWTFRTGSTSSNGSEVGSTLCLNGGFYQGYFKLDLEKPNPIRLTEKTNVVENCSTSGRTFISGYDANGVRVNNEFSNVDPNAFKYELGPTNFDCGVGNGGWSMETWIKWGNPFCSGSTNNSLNDSFSGNSGFFFYIGTRSENKFKNNFSGETGLLTCDGIMPLNQSDGLPRTFNDGQDWFVVNKKCHANESVKVSFSSTTNCDEVSENALGFRVTPDGHIGYRKMTVDGFNYWCSESGRTGGSHFMVSGTKMEESYSDFTINKDEWYHVVTTYSQNSVKHGLPAGTLRIWLNGRVIHRVEDFIGLRLRPLNEWSSKQLGIPYNISWGGGSQGLIESQTFGGMDPNDQGLPISTYFTGTFDGELSQLRFYDKTLNVLEVKNNLYVDCSKYSVDTNIDLITPVSCYAPAGSQGYDNLSGYIYNHVNINGSPKKLAYVECGYYE